MYNRINRISIITLIVLTLTLSFGLSVPTIAQSEQPKSDVSTDKAPIPEGSVLNLIPQDTIGLIYCPSLDELDARINLLIENLIPQAGKTNALAQILAGSFGAGFESLDELEEIGLDITKDFAVFFLNYQPMHVSAAIHLIDPDAMMQVIETEAEGTEPLEHGGITYWSTPDGNGNFVILDDILIFSQDSEICNKVIDTLHGKAPSIFQNADSDMFSPQILNGTEQLGLFINFASFDEPIGEVLNEFTENLDFLNNPMTSEVAPAIERSISNLIGFLEQSDYLSISLQFKGTDIQLRPFMKFKQDSEILNDINVTSEELSNIGVLPNVSIMNSAFQGVPKMLVNFSTFWFDILPKDQAGQLKEAHPLFNEVKTYYESLAERWNMSVDFKDHLLPNYLFIYELKDEEKASTFMNKAFLEKLQSHYNAYAGEVILHNGIEINSINFTNIEMPNQDAFQSSSDLFPEEWQWHYAFTDGHLYLTTGNSDKSIRSALDCRTNDDGNKFANNPSYQRLVERLGTDNNIFLAISPIIAVKNFMPIIAKADPQSGAALQLFVGMFSDLPDNYSIGFSAKAKNNGIDAKLIITTDDFRQLISMFGLAMGGFPMQ